MCVNFYVYQNSGLQCYTMCVYILNSEKSQKTKQFYIDLSCLHGWREMEKGLQDKATLNTESSLLQAEELSKMLRSCISVITFI